MRVIKNILNPIQWFGSYDISIYHQFVKPPYGGGNQFLLALMGELKNIGYFVEKNHISRATRACIFNSYNFDFGELCKYKKKRSNCKMIHRVDGPISVYRGFDDGTDKRIHQINDEIADSTIFQSHFSLDKHLSLGMEFKNPVVIMNASDPRIFNRQNKVPLNSSRKTRIISVSWSDNPKKGAKVYKWLDENLDFSRFEYTFIGNIKQSFENIQSLAPVGSKKLSKIIKCHDMFITASQDDPCSNSLIEAMSCGLPAVYLDSGGHGEIVGDAGERFHNEDDVLSAINKVANDLQGYQEKYSILTLNEVARKYLNAMRIE